MDLDDIRKSSNVHKMKRRPGGFCPTCIYSGTDVVKGYKVLVCKFHPPQRISGVGTGENDQQWPIVSDEDRCSEYSPEASGTRWNY